MPDKALTYYLSITEKHLTRSFIVKYGKGYRSSYKNNKNDVEFIRGRGSMRTNGQKKRNVPDQERDKTGGSLSPDIFNSVYRKYSGIRIGWEKG